MLTRAPIHPIDPQLDLTREMFSAIWWARSAGLTALLGAAVILTLITPNMPPLENGARQAPIPQAQEASLQTGNSSAQQQQDLRAQLDAAKASAAPKLKPASTHETLAIRLAPDQSLGEALTANNIALKDALAAAQALDSAFPVRKIRPSTQMFAVIGRNQANEKPSLDALSVQTKFDEIVEVTRNTQGRYTSERLQLEVNKSKVVASGVIKSSLFLSAEAQSVPPAIIIELIRALSYRVDFQREIRPGDRFEAVYEVQRRADGASKSGSLLYAELTQQSRTQRFYRFTPPAARRPDYFDVKGESLRRMLMRTPIDGARLTSGYGSRRHPVLGYVRNHKGVDFGARTGTPIYAAGDGTVERANRYGSYGNYVRLRHARGFKTAYAHLSKFGKGMKAGKRVSQGDIIGYVGATGRVTGAHLHYEVLKGGKQVNPMRLDLPTGEVLTGKTLTAFKAEMGRIDAIRKASAAPQAANQNAIP